jgi:hypothetical protein
MPTSNPFTDDPTKADVFEQGYVAGFMDPDSSDFRPFAPDLLEAFQQGFQAGRVDRSTPPTVDPASRWLAKPEAEQLREGNGLAEGGEHVAMFAVFHGLDHVFKDVAAKEFSPIPLIELVILALQLQDTPLQELPPDFRAEFNRGEDDPAIHYIAMCPRSDHDLTAAGATPDGYWLGLDRSHFLDAVDDTMAHGHSEAFVARCSLQDDTCGPVWIATSQ